MDTIINTAIIGQIAGFFSLGAYLLYDIAIIRGTTKPSRSTWWILTLVGTMIALSYWISGATDTIWISLSYVIGPLLIAILSLKYGEGSSWDSTDKICFSISCISIGLWFVLSRILGLAESSVIVLLLNISADFLGLVPTLKKSYFNPDHEDLPAWTLESIASIVNIFAINQWIFSIWFYPIYLAIINTLITLLLISRSGKRKKL